MPIERTLSIIKPDATRRNLTGAINDRLERAGLKIVAQKRLRLSEDSAERFYAVHAERPFYRSLVQSLSDAANSGAPPDRLQSRSPADRPAARAQRRRGAPGVRRAPPSKADTRRAAGPRQPRRAAPTRRRRRAIPPRRSPG